MPVVVVPVVAAATVAVAATAAVAVVVALMQFAFQCNFTGNCRQLHNGPKQLTQTDTQGCIPPTLLLSPPLSVTATFPSAPSRTIRRM